MSDITYLFGAGASCGAMPLNLEIPSRLEATIQVLSEFKYVLEGEEFEKKERLLADLNWLLIESKNHASIDTYAKKLYIKRQWKDLKRLRLALSVFFTCEQLGKIPDKRYDAFFASIVSTSIIYLPKNIKILSWNYDYQFELSIMGFENIKDISEAKHYLNCIEKHREYYLARDANFALFKLNGDISLREGNEGTATSPFFPTFNRILNWEVFKEIVGIWYAQIQNGGDFCSNISFAWEKSGTGMLDYTKKQIQNTEVLVVIGYSFPFFNREIDIELISSMVNLRKVYFQSPDANDLEERFKAIDSRETIELVKRFDKYQFLIPNEM